MKKVFQLLSIILFGNLFAQDELFFKPQVGTTYKALLKNGMTMNIDFAGKKATIPATNDIYWTIAVREISSNGNVTMDFTTTRVIMDITDPKTNIVRHYDSDVPQDTKEYEETDAKFREAIGQTSQVIFSNKGEVVQKDSLATNTTLFEFIQKLPNEELKTGFQWTEEREAEISDMKTNIKTVYTVSSIDAEYVIVEGSSTSKLFKEPMKSTIKIHKATGMVVSNTGNGNVDAGFMKIAINTNYALNGF